MVPGTYVVVQTQPGGYLTVSDGDAIDGGDDIANASVLDNRIPVTVTSGETDAGNNFIEELPGTITGHLYIDTNGDGNQDAGEPNLANVDVSSPTPMATPDRGHRRLGQLDGQRAARRRQRPTWTKPTRNIRPATPRPKATTRRA